MVLLGHAVRQLPILSSNDEQGTSISIYNIRQASIVHRLLRNEKDNSPRLTREREREREIRARGKKEANCDIQNS